MHESRPREDAQNNEEVSFMFGRRPDGRRLKKQDPIVQMTPYLMPMRCDAQVFLEHKADFE